MYSVPSTFFRSKMMVITAEYLISALHRQNYIQVWDWTLSELLPPTDPNCDVTLFKYNQNCIKSNNQYQHVIICQQ